MKQHLTLLLVSTLVLLTVQACTQNRPYPADAMPEEKVEGPSFEELEAEAMPEAKAEGLSFEELERERYRYHVEHREQDPKIVGPEGGTARRLLSRWAGFPFRVQQGSTFTIEDDTSSSIALSWEILGANTSGRILSYAFGPPDSAGRRTLWAGAASGGLWKSPDGGDSWQPMTDSLPIMAVSTVAVHPRDSQTLLIGTRDNFGYGGRASSSPDSSYGTGVLRTSDGGRHWQTTSLFFTSEPMDCNQLVWDPVRPDAVYLAASNGVWMSTDAGVTWGAEPVLRGNAKSIVLNKRSPDTLYAALSPIEADTAAGVWQSTDAGAHWTLLTEDLFEAGSLSTTCGICMHLSLAESFPEVIYYSVQMNRGDALYKTSDGGANWKKVTTKVKSKKNAFGFWKAHVSPVDTNVVFAGGVWLYRTTDGGINWKGVGKLEGVDSLYIFEKAPPATRIHVDHQAFGFHPDDPQTVYDFSDGGVYASSDSGNTWTLKNKGLMTLQLYALGSAPSDTAWLAAATQDQGQLILRTRERIPRWRKWLTGDGMQVFFDHRITHNLYATAQWGNHWKFWTGVGDVPWVDRVTPHRNQDGIRGSRGQTKGQGLVQSNKSMSLWIAPLVMDPVNPQILYTARLDSVYKKDNEGFTWRALVAIKFATVHFGGV